MRGPQEDAEIVGKLPKGTILTVLGETEGTWTKVEVELVGGVEQGWVDEKSIKGFEQQAAEDAKKETSKKTKKGKRKKRLPDDELAVIKRDPTFAYGIYGGGNYGILSSTYSEPLYQGIGGQGGGFVYWFLDRDMSIGTEVGITQLSGSQGTLDPTDTSSSGKGTARLFDIAGVFEYMYQNFRFFGALQYSVGIGIADFPLDAPPSASDFSGFWIKAGLGYAIPLGDLLNLVGKGSYGYSFNREFVGFQNFTFSAYLEFRG